MSVLLTPGKHPLEELAVRLANEHRPSDKHSVAADAVHAALTAEPASIRLAIGQILADRAGTASLLIVVDQFEEVFTLCGDEAERSAFIAALLASADDSRVRVVVGVRADFYARCAAYPALVAALHGCQLLIGPMDDDDVRQVITGPAAYTGLVAEPALVEVATADVRGQVGGLPLLSHALLETWRRRQGNRLTLATYQATGGVKGAIAQTAERVYGELDEERRRLVRDVMLRLTAFGEGTEDTRRRAARAELMDGPAPQTMVDVLDRLTAARLVTADKDRVTIAHEALIQEWPRLRGWLMEDRELLRAHRRLTEAAIEWEQHDRENGFLYLGARLAGWHERGADCLNEVERAFLAASRTHEIREQKARRRRSRLAMSGLGMTMAVVGTLAGVALVQADRANAERDLALSRQLTAEARNQLQLDPERALQLARQAFTARPTIEAEMVLRQAVADHRTQAVIPLDSPRALGVAFSPDGRKLAATGSAGEVRVWAWNGRSVSGPPLLLKGHEGEVWSPVFSPDGRRLATCGQDGTIRIWQAGSTDTATVLRGHAGPVWAVTFSPDGRKVASAGQDATVRIWDAEGAGTPTVLRGHRGVAVGVSFSPDGRRLASSSHDRTVRLWDLTRPGNVTVLTGPQEGTKTLAFNPDGTRLASSCSDGTAWVWPLAGPGTPVVLRGHAGTVEGLALSPDGQRIATTSDDSTVRLWSAIGAGDPLVLRGHTNRVWAVAFSPDGLRLASAADDGTIRIWDADSKRVLLHPQSKAESRPVWAATFTPDGQRVVGGGEDRAVRIWSVARPTDPLVLRGHTDEVLGLAVSPDGRRVASGGRDGTVRVWSTTGGGDPVVLRGHDGPVWVADFSPDGHLLASAGRDGTLRIWHSAGDGAPAVRRTTGQIRYAAFSPDGKRVVTGGEDGTVRVWDTTGAAEPLILRGHEGLVWGVAFSPDGRRVASAGFDGTARIWSLTDDRAPLILHGHQGPVWYAAFSPDGRWLATSGKDATVRLWSTAENGPPVTFNGFGASVESVDFSPDGTRLVTAHDDGTVRIWPCTACGPITLVLAPDG